MNLLRLILILMVGGVCTQAQAESAPGESVVYRQVEVGWFRQKPTDSSQGDDYKGISFELKFGLLEDSYGWVSQRNYSDTYIDGSAELTREIEEFRFGAMKVWHGQGLDWFAGVGVFRQIETLENINYSNQGTEFLVGIRKRFLPWQMQSELLLGHRDALRAAPYARISATFPMGQRFSLLMALESDDSNPGALVGLSLDY